MDVARNDHLGAVGRHPYCLTRLTPILPSTPKADLGPGGAHVGAHERTAWNGPNCPRLFGTSELLDSVKVWPRSVLMWMPLAPLMLRCGAVAKMSVLPQPSLFIATSSNRTAIFVTDLNSEKSRMLVAISASVETAVTTPSSVRAMSCQEELASGSAGVRLTPPLKLPHRFALNPRTSRSNQGPLTLNPP